MKCWGVALFLLLVCPSVWGQANSFSFISTLSSPVASFYQLETKLNSETTTFPNGAVFNVGAAVQGANGEIVVDGNGGPILISQLTMQDGTTLSSEATSRWLVNTMTIHPGGVVSVAQLIANTVTLANVPGTMQIQQVTFDTVPSGGIGASESIKFEDDHGNMATLFRDDARNINQGTATWYNFTGSGSASANRVLYYQK